MQKIHTHKGFLCHRFTDEMTFSLEKIKHGRYETKTSRAHLPFQWSPDEVESGVQSTVCDAQSENIL